MQSTSPPSDNLNLESDLEQLRIDLKVGMESSSSSTGTNSKLPPIFKFSPESRLRRIVASPDVLEFLVASISSNPQDSFLPSLDFVKILYKFTGMARFNPATLCACLESIKVLAPESIGVHLEFKNKDCLGFKLPGVETHVDGLSHEEKKAIRKLWKVTSQVRELDLCFPVKRDEIMASFGAKGIFDRVISDFRLLFRDVTVCSIVPAGRKIDCDLQMRLYGQKLGPVYVNNLSTSTVMWF
ncbi:hypothetical protein EST38_g12767 [Candolleomyces aberdarensis]|uniref:Uncharacterized protein n=1 Tax=Candolleomyces aberdarensis TaxID=2316362 RepID=A0A4Q2D1L8_9AGAR|nr:hypothetical protein EST38_g12767 [Candolleomyces aberdarensis]